MGTIPVVLATAAIVLFAFPWIGGPILIDWLRHRREEIIKRQIALTDAIDGQLGPIVAPVVKKPLLGPWQIRIAVPISRPAAIGRILAVVHAVLSTGDGMHPGSYQIVLTPKQDLVGEARGTRASHPTERWRGRAVTA